MPAFRSLEVWSDVQGNGGQRLAVLPDGLSISPVYDITGDESLTVALPRSSPAYASLQEKRALRIVRRNAAAVETFEEWRVAERTDRSGAGDPPAEVVARSLLLDLGDAIISTQLSDGTTSFQFGFVDLTLAQIITNYCLPALAAIGKGYFFLGTIDSTVTITRDYDRQSVLSLLKSLAEEPRFNLELRLRQNGILGQFIDMLTEVGVGAPMPRVETRKNLDSTVRSRSTAEQATVAIPQGPDIGGGQRAGIESMRYVVSAVDAVHSRITLADELGVFVPIQFDTQYAGWLIFRELTGRSISIVTSYKATQEVEIADLSTIAIGERISFRVSDAMTNTLNWRGSHGTVPLYYITAVSGGSSRITVKETVAGTGGQFANDDAIDWTAVCCAKIAVFISGVSGFDAVGQYYQLGAVSLTPVQIGDIVWMDVSGNVDPSYGGNQPGFPIGTVTSVDNVLKRITVVNRYDDASPVFATSGSTAGNLRVYRPALSSLVRDSFFATDELQLASVAGAAVNQVVEIRQPCGGVLPTALVAPAAAAPPPTGYGIIARFLDRPEMNGETELVPNAFMRAWSGAANVPPDGWSMSGAAPVIARTTNPLFTKYGGKSALFTFVASGVGNTLRAPAFPVWRVGSRQRTRISIRLRIYFEVLDGDNAVSVNVAGRGASINNVKQFFSVSHPTAAAADKYAVGTFYEIGGISVDCAALQARGDLAIELAGGGTTGAGCRAYVDVVQVTQTTYDPGLFLEGSGAVEMVSEGNRYLEDFSAPVTEYSLKLRDLERIDGTPWPEDAIVIGGKLDFNDTDLGVATLPRVVRYLPNELDPMDSDVIVSTRRKPLTRILSEAF